MGEHKYEIQELTKIYKKSLELGAELYQIPTQILTSILLKSHHFNSTLFISSLFTKVYSSHLNKAQS